ncbi:MAG TPA: DUF1499 domain-containing protein [Gemmatimonadales bacterium]|nr:DUF1499 domain-containing protein [Gemmatimonadales bacterium]
MDFARRVISTMRRATITLAMLAVLLMALAGPGARLGLWSFGTGFDVLRWGAYLGFAAGAAALVQLVVPRWRAAGAWPLILALALGVLAAGVPWVWQRRAETVPPIHDISTDTDDPPAFVAVLPLRADAPNPAAYGGPEVAAAQAQAYPDIRPLVLPATTPAELFPRARAAARAAGWAIVAADSAAGRIEATATTGWFGFQDDVVIRIRPEGTGSRLDARSVSRLGTSDVGTNARRIRAYLASLAGGE